MERSYELVSRYLNGEPRVFEPEFDPVEKGFLDSLEKLKPELEKLNQWTNTLGAITALCAVFSVSNQKTRSNGILGARENLTRYLSTDERLLKVVIENLSDLFFIDDPNIDNMWRADLSGNLPE